MDQTFTCVLLLLSMSATFGRFCYIKERKTWHEAQKYCRQHHTDLAFASNNQEISRLMQLANHVNDRYWIGLVQNSTDSKKWMWSGGGEVSTSFWADGQPEKRPNEDYGMIYQYKWRDSFPESYRHFFCYSVDVVREKKTWEEALKYCRERRKDLATVMSEAEMSLIKTEVDKYDTTDYVWIGLRFLSGRWLWVDGEPMRYKAWGPEGKPECPDFKLGCAALKHVWKALDCEERLPFICQ